MFVSSSKVRTIHALYLCCNSGLILYSYKAFSNGQLTMFVSSSKVRTIHAL